jgi:hypothetical protein
VDRATFERRLAELTRAQDSLRDNVGCVQCTRCERCIDSTFCQESVALRRCSYCKACRDCANCTSCTGCTGCNDCQHCSECTQCLRGAYLVRSSGCIDCSYCFGCVGLVGKDFHILNEPYGRTEYFATIAKLSRELGIKAA